MDNFTEENQPITEEAVEDTAVQSNEFNEGPGNVPAAGSADSNDGLQQKFLEANDKLLRLMAEFDNFKKRSIKEKEDLFAFIVCDIVAGFLPVLDNLDRAVIAGAESEDKSLLDGVKLVQKQFTDTLTALGVEEIKSVGEEFDPELHNAVMHIEDNSVGANVIIEEFMKGYIYKGKVIRHSMVKSAN